METKKNKEKQLRACAPKLQTINSTGDSSAVPEKVPAMVQPCIVQRSTLQIQDTQDGAQVAGAPPFPGRVSVTGHPLKVMAMAMAIISH